MSERDNHKVQSWNRRVAPLVLAALLALAAEVRGQCQYAVQEWAPAQCEIWGTINYTGTGLNNLGAWCGYRKMCYPEEGSPSATLPVYCPPNGVPQVLPMPPGAGPYGARAWGVNDAGVVAGVSFEGPNGVPEKGCIWWPDGTITVIPPAPGATNSPAYAINNSNMVVGNSGTQPYVWQDGVLTSIPVPPGLGFGGAWRVSDNGFVVGTFGNQNSNARAYRWKNGELSLLEPLPNHPISVARDVNSTGVVVGYSKVHLFPLPSLYTPTMWLSDGTPIELPMLAGFTLGGASRINDQGIITGEIGEAGPPYTAVAWIDGVCFKLNSLTVPGSPTVSSPAGLSDSNLMLTGGSARLLTPLGQSFADVNGDCAVDGADIAKLLGEWGPREWSVADLDDDGVVDGRDLGLMLGEWTAASK